jgi:DNA (cytosine-5)-methyltransferase 1
MYNFIEVCAGCGGLGTGLVQAGFKPILFNEINKVYSKTLQHNHPGIELSCEDINKIDLGKYKGTVDLLAGGVPCQSFSHAGKRKGFDDDRGNLILRFSELISQCKPRVFLIENVKGLLTHKSSDGLKTIDIVINNLKDLNIEYKIRYQVLNAFEYGVPQKRERLFIIGTRDGVEFKFPDNIDDRFMLADVLSGIVGPGIGYEYSANKKRVMDMVPQGGCWVDLPKEVQEEYMGKILESSGGKRGYAKRLSMSQPCTTLTTSPCQKQTEKCHPLITRPLNVDEYAAIQTFPKDYIFFGSIAQQYAQIGNAVPVKLAFHIGESIKKALISSDNIEMVSL